ncbi:glutamine synthetase family protein [Microbaculum marinisediminis]|uniref:Glutamine synthetase n=1 Tax=Microbaculum marinisediminis TaxID=2931392 RepID=A0AAW5R5H4_9HYPH|nr:glutamine synthetase [Microbaculum sp. A6E488]MCT8973918.1 glutamine synthetase [Microbaculum sp. A6E488]
MDNLNSKIRSLKEQGVEYVFGFYVDINGAPKSKCVPIESLASMLGGSELYTVGALEGMGELGPHEDECAGYPDLDRMIVLPWDRRFALIPSSLRLDGTRYNQDSRNLLLNVTEEAAELGFVANVGIEPEFYVVRDTEGGWEPLVASDRINPPTCGYDIEATMLAEPFLGPMVKYMNELGWGVYSFDHEGGDGQYEFNFRYADALTMADRMTIFRLMAKHVARQNGCIATFMPKPFQDDFGSASHINISIASAKDGENLFASGGAYSELAMHFVAGVLEHARAISAVVCPTVNSYKRFTSKGFMDEISWAPIFQAWGENNRTLMCRMPVNRHCLEVRTADSAVNYYLGIAMVLAAGLDGIKRKLTAPEPVNVDTYKLAPADLVDRGCVPLPRTLDEALDAFEESGFAREVFGEEFHATFLKHKRHESHEFRTVVTEWEIQKYLQRI